MQRPRQCPSCGGSCGYTKKKGCQYANIPRGSNEELKELTGLLSATRIEDKKRIESIGIRLIQMV